MHTMHGLIAQSPSMRALLALVERFAPHSHVALIRGEPGSGRSTIAWLMHRMGPHRSGRYHEVQCSPAAGPDTIADLFPADPGHEETDANDVGSIVLDEVADLAKPAQASLLGALVALDRFARYRRVPPVAVIAKSCRDLAREVQRDAFRADLWYRLNAFEVSVPALRDRREDIPALASFFATEWAHRLGQETPRFSSRAVDALRSRSWPGNLRELRNVVERSCILSDDPVIGEHVIVAALASSPAATSPGTSDGVPDQTVSDRLDVTQRAHVRAVLARERGNKTRAAKQLGLSRRSLYRLLDRIGA
jgi:DNA-binding NtrC family response regulator